MEGLSQQSIENKINLPREPHNALICGQTNCGKTVFVLDLLQSYYKGCFENIVILCTTVRYNKTYQDREWLWNNPYIYIINPRDRLDDVLRLCHELFTGESTLYIIDDCSATKAITQKKHMLSELAFSGRHTDQSVWILTQKYNSVLKDFREQTRWIALFHCKDRDSFEECLRENDVIPTLQERKEVRQQLAATKHAKLILKTDQPTDFVLSIA